MDNNIKFSVALIYDFDGTLSAGNMQEYNFIPAIGKSNKEFWSEANDLAEQQDADQILTYKSHGLYQPCDRGDGEESPSSALRCGL